MINRYVSTIVGL